MMKTAKFVSIEGQNKFCGNLRRFGNHQLYFDLCFGKDAKDVNSENARMVVNVTPRKLPCYRKCISMWNLYENDKPYAPRAGEIALFVTGCNLRCRPCWSHDIRDEKRLKVKKVYSMDAEEIVSNVLCRLFWVSLAVKMKKQFLPKIYMPPLIRKPIIYIRFSGAEPALSQNWENISKALFLFDNKEKLDIIVNALAPFIKKRLVELSIKQTNFSTAEYMNSINVEKELAIIKDRFFAGRDVYECIGKNGLVFRIQTNGIQFGLGKSPDCTELRYLSNVKVIFEVSFKGVNKKQFRLISGSDNEKLFEYQCIGFEKLTRTSNLNNCVEVYPVLGFGHYTKKLPRWRLNLIDKNEKEINFTEYDEIFVEKVTRSLSIIKGELRYTMEDFQKHVEWVERRGYDTMTKEEKRSFRKIVELVIITPTRTFRFPNLFDCEARYTLYENLSFDALDELEKANRGDLKSPYRYKSTYEILANKKKVLD